jgi:hypothetical protein
VLSDGFVENALVCRILARLSQSTAKPNAAQYDSPGYPHRQTPGHSGVRPCAGTLYTTPACSRKARKTQKNDYQLATMPLASQLIVISTITIRVYSVRPRKTPSPKNPASAGAGRMEASRSSTSNWNAAAILATWTPNVPRNSPSAP